MRDNRRDAEELHAALWSAIDNGAEPPEIIQATEAYLEAAEVSSDDSAVLVAAANRLETAGQLLVENGDVEEAADVLGVALRAAGEGGHLVLTNDLLERRDELLADLGRDADGLQRRYLRLLSSSSDAELGTPVRADRGSDVGQARSDDGRPQGDEEAQQERTANLFGPTDDGLSQATPSPTWDVPEPTPAKAEPERSRARPDRAAGETPSARDRPDEPDMTDLWDYLTAIRRRWWVMVLTVMVTVGTAMAVSLTETPVYESTSQLLVEGSGAGGGGDQVLAQLVLGDRQLSTFSELVGSQPVASLAAERLEGQENPSQLADQVTASVVEQTQLLEVRAQHTDPERAAAIAEAFSKGFLEFRSQQILEQVSRANRSLQNRQEQLNTRLNEIDQQLRRASGQEQTRLQAEKERIESELAGLSSQQAALSGSEAAVGGGGQVVRPAEVPDRPISPQPVRSGALAAALGLMLGAGLAFGVDFLDDTVRSESQAVTAAGVDAVGRVPTWKADGPTGKRLATLMEPASPVSEAYRTLRTSVRYLMAGRQASSLLVTSPLSGEGKTTTAGNLAVAFADAGLRTLMVGGDLRRPLLHEMVGVAQEPGLTDAIVGDVKVEDVLQDVGVDGLRVLPSGRVPPNPAEFLNSPAFRQLARTFEQVADVVVYDAAPVLPVADSLELSSVVDISLLVVDIDASGRRSVSRSSERLRDVGADLAGIILNNVHRDEVYYGEYSSHY